MIINVPTAEELRTISLRLYFKAWVETAEIVIEWYEHSGLLELPKWLPDEGRYVDDPKPDMDGAWGAYLQAAQSDLQSIYTLTQQSQEIGIKALICEVSPYLLLKGKEAKAAIPGNSAFDFTDFPTIDAADLIKVHNIFCNRVITPEFQAQVDDIRRSRNKIYHLGIYRREIDPGAMIDVLLSQYRELYPGRRWLADRNHYATLHRWSFADFDSGEWSPKTEVFNELWHLIPVLPEVQFRTVMQHDLNQERLICHSCAAEANLGEREPYPHDVPTAYRIGDTLQLHCAMCDRIYNMRTEACTHEGCQSELTSAELGSDGRCVICGWDRGDVEYDDKLKADAKARAASASNPSPD